MIDKKELRYGNLVSLAHESNAPIVTITGIGHGMVDVEGMTRYYEYEDLMPIELTPDWLRKLGFKSTSDTEDIYRYPHEGDCYILIGKLRKNPKFTMFELWFTDNNGDATFPFALPENQYVHSVQNLIRYLTGEELTIKTD